MSNRAQDWLTQATRDLEQARLSHGGGYYEWACFASHQAAEKAVKAMCLSFGGEAWGHSITRLLKDLENHVEIPEELGEPAQHLDKHYLPTRYPNGFDAGAPAEYYTEGEAQRAITDAKRILDFCRQSLDRP